MIRRIKCLVFFFTQNKVVSFIKTKLLPVISVLVVDEVSGLSL